MDIIWIYLLCRSCGCIFTPLGVFIWLFSIESGVTLSFDISMCEVMLMWICGHWLLIIDHYVHIVMHMCAYLKIFMHTMHVVMCLHLWVVHFIVGYWRLWYVRPYRCGVSFIGHIGYICRNRWVDSSCYECNPPSLLMFCFRTMGLWEEAGQ